MKRRILMITMTGLLAGISPVRAQTYLKNAIPYHNRVMLSTTDGFIEAELMDGKQTANANPAYWYSWYSQDSIRHTQGGYNGRLLHGNYRELYADKQLKVSGTYYRGLKNGTWFHRDSDGTLRKTATWHRGRETGPFAFYNEKGELVQRGRLRSGKFQGRVTTVHTGDSVYQEKKKYSKGKEVPETKKRFWHFW